jgi:prepilin-type N-terminal cleavage/methylation domain-containing protein
MQIANCKLRIANCRHAAESERTARNPQSEIRNPKSRPGVTLIELLVVILIISILAALVLGVAAVAGETARQAQTKHTVERMHTLLMEFYDSFKNRRVKLRATDATGAGIEQQISKLSNPASQRQALAEARLYATRELVLIEVPDRWCDVVLDDVGTANTGDDDPVPPANPVTKALAPVYLSARTELSNAYLRRYAGLVGRINTATGVANTAGDIKRNQGAECLYMIITMACGDGEARSLFKDSEIGDTDGDGAPEFLDGWGHPISFLRWVPGFDSQIQLNQNAIDQLLKGSAADKATATANIAKDHDPLDVYRRDPNAFRLVPLIYSPGRDESYGLVSDPGELIWRGRNSPPQLLTIGNNPNAKSQYITFPILDPYQLRGTPPAYIGTDIHIADPANFPDATATDNIHNHMLGLR